MAEKSLYDQALRLLEYRPRSVAEMRRRLLEKGSGAAAVDAVIERLLDQKLLDDAAYARQFARGKLTAGGASRFRVAQHLLRKGIRRDAAHQAIAELAEEEGVDPLAAALRLARRKWNSMASEDAAVRRRRLYAFLARRGFDPDEIRQLLRAVESQE